MIKCDDNDFSDDYDNNSDNSVKHAVFMFINNQTSHTRILHLEMIT